MTISDLMVINLNAELVARYKERYKVTKEFKGDLTNLVEYEEEIFVEVDDSEWLDIDTESSDEDISEAEHVGDDEEMPEPI